MTPIVSRPSLAHPTTKTWAPVSYTSQVTGLSAGQSLPFPQVSLQSGFNTPYLIDEIRFTAYTESYTTAAITVGDLAAIVSYNLHAGPYMFSQGGFGQAAYVPMMLYAPTYSGAAQYENVSQLLTATTSRKFTTRRWVLPKPLYMPPGDTIMASVHRTSNIGTAIPNITAQITIIGRALPPSTPPPALRQVPYVGYYVHPSTATYSEANFQLQNPFNSTWNVQRLILGTRNNVQADSGLATGAGFYEDPTGVVRYASLKITDSMGYKVTGSSGGGFIPLADIAAVQRDSAWTFSRPVPPEEQFNVATQITPGSGTNTAFDVLMSFVGYRDE